MTRAWTGTFLAAALLGAALAGSAQPARAGSVELYPVRVDLSATGATSAMRVRNTGAGRLTMEVRTVRWSQSAGEDAYEPTRTVLASPPVFELQPGQEQVVRLGLLDRAVPAREGAYRVFLQELPEPSPTGGGAVQTLLRISVPIFVAPAAAGEPALAWTARRDGQGLLLEARNDGPVHARVSGLALGWKGGPLRDADRAGGYVLAGQSRRFRVDPPPGGGSRPMELEVRTTDGTSRVTLDVR
ncbi:molecular chaperone [Azospirillum sp. SYSU D00513]|uniref:fimbrial biogenesis chaperone n=1 Tax=Azospirillum sp. SYSU D00513 TaxID=2812561 RepID=UPI001A96D274|nr:molecular chaperone [Azospirillum sp. SYSU D00513]